MHDRRQGLNPYRKAVIVRNSCLEVVSDDRVRELSNVPHRMHGVPVKVFSENFDRGVRIGEGVCRELDKSFLNPGSAVFEFDPLNPFPRENVALDRLEATDAKLDGYVAQVVSVHVATVKELHLYFVRLDFRPIPNILDSSAIPPASKTEATRTIRCHCNHTPTDASDFVEHFF